MTTLRLFNTLTKTKEDFVPLDPKNVRMYVCGPTVYDFAHIGNARPAIVFDVLYRLLKHLYPGAGKASDGSCVEYVRNITDIDDKINARAAERRGNRDILTAVRELTEQTYGVYREDVTALGCLEPTYMPRATDNIAPMIAMTKTLIDNGHAYEASGHVLFDVSSKPDYGKLARRSVDDMIAGARVDVAPYKKSPMDFVLWKPSNDNTPGWDSPWGRGRPGWHLECSAMIAATFKFESGGGDTIDIHGGGIDLVFPHHENEIAQSEGAHHDHPLAKVWMHNGFLNVEGEKMSKSLGNFVTINELLKDWDGRALRVNMLKRHYRLPMDWTSIGMRESRNLLWEWEDQVPEKINLQARQSPNDWIDAEVVEALNDDLNTHLALARIHELSRFASRSKNESDQLRLAASMDFLGLLPSVVRSATGHAIGTSEVRAVGRGLNLPEIDRAIEARNAARARKDFKESDRIRDELFAQGIVLKDTPQGTMWEVKR